mmetsp:Transcript_17051/g.49391  ORF Transcript_17051/g.49391 Transcript_17051/m.49391 type:complete len:249 (-) Transcript_17051:222-968(-)
MRVAWRTRSRGGRLSPTVPAPQGRAAGGEPRGQVEVRLLPPPLGNSASHLRGPQARCGAPRRLCQEEARPRTAPSPAASFWMAWLCRFGLWIAVGGLQRQCASLERILHLHFPVGCLGLARPVLDHVAEGVPVVGPLVRLAVRVLVVAVHAFLGRELHVHLPVPLLHRVHALAVLTHLPAHWHELSPLKVHVLVRLGAVREAYGVVVVGTPHALPAVHVLNVADGEGATKVIAHRIKAVQCAVFPADE